VPSDLKVLFAKVLGKPEGIFEREEVKELMISAARGARKLALKDSQRFFEKELAQFRREYEEYRKKFFYDDKDFLEFMEKVNKVAMY
jgi:hypothetical protein